MEELFLLEFYVKNIEMRCKIGKGEVETDDDRLNVDIDFGKFASINIRQDEFDADILEYDSDGDDDECLEMVEAAIAAAAAGAPGADGGLKECDSKENAAEEEDEGDENIQIIERRFKSGASVLFSNSSDNLCQMFKLFPMELYAYTTNEFDKKVCIGISKVFWPTDFCEILENRDKCIADKRTQLTWHTVEPLISEDCGTNMGQIQISVRFTLLGKFIKSKFKETLCRVTPSKSPFTERKVSISCNLYGVSIRQKRESMQRTYQKSGYVEYLVKLIEATIRQEFLDVLNVTECTAACSTGGSKKESGGGAAGKKDAGKNDDCCGKKEDNCGECDCGGCGKTPGSCPFKSLCQECCENRNEFIVCPECGGYSLTGKTCETPGIEKPDNTGKKYCEGPCNTSGDFNELNCAQNLVYEGLQSMLRSAQNQNHRKFCPEYLHAGLCRSGACKVKTGATTPKK